jgi:hypothetical protein
MKNGSPDRIRLSRWHEYTVYVVIAGLYITGVIWLVCHFFLADEGEYGPMPHEWEGPMMMLHGAAAMLTLFFVGSLLTVHMVKAWRSRRNRWSGSFVAGFALVLTLTGYCLYYVGDDDIRAWMSWAHWLPGVPLPLVLAIHVFYGTRRPVRHRKPRTRRPVATDLSGRESARREMVH